MTWRYEKTRIVSSATITTVIGRIRCRAAAPAAASTARIASGPYATEVSASSDSADSPSTGVICSRDTSRARSGGPISSRQSARGQPPRSPAGSPPMPRGYPRQRHQSWRPGRSAGPGGGRHPVTPEDPLPAQRQRADDDQQDDVEQELKEGTAGAGPVLEGQ